jgi:hypothetical protein
MVRRLTDIFYRIRFGGATLDAGRRRRLNIVLARLERALENEARHHTTII